MDFNRYTNKAQEALLRSQSLATEYGHSEIDPLHILIALMSQKDGVVPEVVAKIGGRAAALHDELNTMLTSRPRVSGSNVKPGLNRAAQDAVNRAEREAEKMRDEYTSTEHLLIGMAEDRTMRGLLEKHGVTRDA
ncbi:MAG: type VI secretion system ATPase TssH, partial [Blastochloris sp.]|nr:type VI secretion system ATPase TssH [Blastochloris sp.]